MITAIFDGPHHFSPHQSLPTVCGLCMSEREAENHRQNVRWILIGGKFLDLFPVDPVSGEPLPYPSAGWQRSSEIAL